MGMGSLEILVIIVMNGGGGSDLLDYVPTDFYWEENSVRAVTPEAMQRVLEDDSADDIDRLMAIRAMGELGDESSLAVLGPLVDSNDPFVGHYARRSIAWIRGEDPEPASTVTRDQLDADLALLPSDVMFAGQSTGILPATGPIDMAAIVPNLAGTGGPSPKELADEVAEEVLLLIEQVGNVRLDSLTFGAAFDEETEQPSIMMVIARGAYNRERTIEMLSRESDMALFTIGDIEVARETTDWGESTALLMPADDHLIFMFGEAEGFELPIDETVLLIEEDETELALGGMLLDQIDLIDREATPVWLVMEVPEMFKQNEPGEIFGAFEAARFTGALNDDGGFTVSCVGQGTDADAVAQTARVIQGYIDDGIFELQDNLEFEPEMKPLYDPLLDMLRSIELNAEGDTLTVEMQMPYSPGMFFSLFWVGM